MPISFDRRINIQGKDSFAVLPLATYVGVTKNVKIDFSGNSLLSTLFVQSIASGTVAVNYFDFTTGFEVDERHDLESHLTPVVPLGTDRILVTNLHNKAIAEVIITGEATIGIYGTIVDFSASDIDNALVREGQDVVLANDKGLIAAYYNPTDGKYHFGRIDNDGNICVKNTPNAPDLGDLNSNHFDDQRTSTPGTAQDTISEITPVGFDRFLRKVIVSYAHPADFTIFLGADIIGSGRTGPGEPNAVFDWGETPLKTVPAEVVKITFEACDGWPADSVETYLHVSDQAI